MYNSALNLRSNPLGLYFLLSRILPGVSLLLVFGLFAPSSTTFGIPTVVILFVVGFPTGQFIYSTAALVEKRRSSQEYHRLEFQRLLSEEANLENGVFGIFEACFRRKYGADPGTLDPNDVYRLTRSAIELDNRGRSLQWDALQSFSRTMKYALLLGSIAVLLAPLFLYGVLDIYTPLVERLSPSHLVAISVGLLVTGSVFHRAEMFYKKGYVNYLIADFCNIYGYEVDDPAGRGDR